MGGVMDISQRLDKLRDLDFQVMAGKPEKELHSQYAELNYIDISPETEVYRIFAFKRLLDSIINRRLTLVRPSSWHDPYENFLLNARGVLSDGTPISFAPVRDLFYGQCWTLRKECDGLWKAVSRRSVGVKVASKASKLMQYFYDTSHPYHSLSYFIGLVNYVPDIDIHAYFARKVDWIFRGGGQSLGLLLTLFIKRTAFDYEKEVRLVFRLPNSDAIDLTKVTNPWNNKSRLFHVKIDPNDAFQEIAFNPTTDLGKYNLCTTKLRNAGYKGQISRSDLYDNPNFIAHL